MSTEFNAIYSPRFELSVGGARYQEADGRIGDLLVETTVDGAALCSFTLNYPFDLEFGDITDVDWGALEPGVDIEAGLGWGGAGTVEPVFVGTGQTIRMEVTPDAGPTLAVSGYGLLHGMMHGVVERSWSDASVVDVATEVLNEYFPSVDVDGPGITRNRIIQHGENDYRFLRRLAETYGFEFYAERDTAYFRPRTAIGRSDTVVTLAYGKNLDAVSTELSTAQQVAAVEVRAWDASAEKEIVGSASGGAGTGKEVFRVACDSKQEADRIAEGKLSALSKARTTGRGETEGNPAIAAGRTIRLENLGSRFTGDYYVTRATHRVGDTGYRTSFEVEEIPT